MMRDLAGCRVVVTGGSGFIGSHLIDALVYQGAAVVNLDLRPPVLESQLGLWKHADLRDQQSVSGALSATHPHVIYNLAAHASLAGGERAMEVNVQGLASVLRGMELLAPRPHLIHASTQLVTGVLGEGFDPNHFQPYGEYGQSKARSEQTLLSIGESAPWTIVRPTNIWGPRHPTFARAIWRYINWRLYLHPAGVNVVRSYGYVGNVVDQLVRAARVAKSEVLNRTFYVGDEPVDSAVWLDGFSRALTGRPVRRVSMPVLQLLAGVGEQMRRIGAPSPINRGRLERMTANFPVPMQQTFALLGRGPYDLDAGIAETVKWLRGTAWK